MIEELAGGELALPMATGSQSTRYSYVGCQTLLPAELR